MLRLRMSRVRVCALAVTMMLTAITVSSPSARAGLILGVTVEGVSSERSVDGRLAVNTINGSGLSVGNHDSNLANMWLTELNLSSNDPWIIYDLGNNYNVASLHLWNYNESGISNFQPNSDRGIKTATIFTSSTDTSPTWTSQGTFSFAKAFGSSTYAGEDKTLAVSNVRLVKIQALTNWKGYSYPASWPGGYQNDYNAVTGLSEIQFDGVLVPEPSTLLLLACGLIGLLAYAWRRRRG